MKLSLEGRALGCAVLAAMLSLGSAWLAASPIEMVTRSMVVAAGSEAAPGMAVPPAVLAQGHEFYGQSCSDCHGEDARGDEGPDLHNLALSDGRIATQIRNGVKGEMPAFGKKYDAEQIGALVSYVRGLR